MKIGCTTGFYKSMVDILLEDAKKQGYVPDASVAGDEVRNYTRHKDNNRQGGNSNLDCVPRTAVVAMSEPPTSDGQS